MTPQIANTESFIRFHMSTNGLTIVDALANVVAVFHDMRHAIKFLQKSEPRLYIKIRGDNGSYELWRLDSRGTPDTLVQYKNFHGETFAGDYQGLPDMLTVDEIAKLEHAHDIYICGIHTVEIDGVLYHWSSDNKSFMKDGDQIRKENINKDNKG